MTDAGITATITAYAHGGPLTRPTLIVIHDAECPLEVGRARSVASWEASSTGPGTSAHAVADPAETIQTLSDDLVAWQVGAVANAFTLGIEQAGYASYTRAQWTTPAGLAQIARVGKWVRAKALDHGIPLRWATDAQIRAAAQGIPGGVCRHADVARVLGGTTHTDPGNDYPVDLLAQAWGNPQEDPLAALSDADAAKLAANAQWLVDQFSAIGDVASSADPAKRTPHGAAFYLGYAKFYAQQNNAVLAQLTAQLAALNATVAALSKGSGLTADQLTALAQAAATAALRDLGSALAGSGQ